MRITADIDSEDPKAPAFLRRLASFLEGELPAPAISARRPALSIVPNEVASAARKVLEETGDFAVGKS